MLLAVDTETTGLELHHGDKPFYVSTCDEEGNVKSWEWPVDPETREPQIPEFDLNELANYLDGKELVFHNAKYDLRALSKIGLPFVFKEPRFTVPPTEGGKRLPFSIDCPTFHDTRLQIHALASGEPQKGLKPLACKYLDYPDQDEKELHTAVLQACRNARKIGGYELGYNSKGQRQTLSDYWVLRALDPTNDLLATYADCDAERTILLHLCLFPQLEEQGLYEQYWKEISLLPVIYQMESEGITVNRKKIHDKIAFLGSEVEKQLFRLRVMAGRRGMKDFNPASPIQLAKLLYDKYELPVIKTTDKGNPSTDKDTLEKLLDMQEDKHGFRARFLRYLLIMRLHDSGWKHLIGYSKQNIPDKDNDEYGTLYYNLNQSGAQTTRFSSNDPNGQNVSKIKTREIGGSIVDGPMLREAFGPKPKHVWYALDYSQLELRVFAAASEEPALIDALADGYDFHDFVAKTYFAKDDISDQERRFAKAIVFGIIFGAGKKKITQMTGDPKAHRNFSALFPNVATYMKRVAKQVEENNYVYTLDGYRLDVPARAPHKGVNYIVQGTAGRIIKNAMIDIHRKLIMPTPWARLVLQIHDELIVELTDQTLDHMNLIYAVKEEMEQAGQDLGIITPVSIEEITDNWGNGVELNLEETQQETVLV